MRVIKWLVIISLISMLAPPAYSYLQDKLQSRSQKQALTCSYKAFKVYGDARTGRVDRAAYRAWRDRRCRPRIKRLRYERKLRALKRQYRRELRRE